MAQFDGVVRGGSRRTWRRFTARLERDKGREREGNREREEARARARSKEQGAGEEGGRGGKWEQGGGSVGCRPGKGVVGEVGDEADAQAPRVSGRREERRGQLDGPRPKRKKGGEQDFSLFFSN